MTLERYPLRYTYLFVTPNLVRREIGGIGHNLGLPRKPRWEKAREEGARDLDEGAFRFRPVLFGTLT